MGVCGCGKSTVGRELSKHLGGVFIDADDFHPPANIAKMAAGKPLTDADREPWLQALNVRLRDNKQNEPVQVLACSALKQSYRRILSAGIKDWTTIWLDGPKEVLAERIDKRTDHFMPASLLDSQLRTLEVPSPAIRVSVDNSLSTIIGEIDTALRVV